MTSPYDPNDYGQYLSTSQMSEDLLALTSRVKLFEEELVELQLTVVNQKHHIDLLSSQLEELRKNAKEEMLRISNQRQVSNLKQKDLDAQTLSD